MEQPETSVLTEKQERFALSGKKNKKRDRHGHTVIASPYDPYWPVLAEDAEVELNQLLLSVLHPVRRPVSKVNWSELRKVPLKQRREVRQKLQQESNADFSSDRSEELRRCMFLGVNSVTRGLESASVGFVLLAQDADPKILVSHIPTMCAMQGVPILIMPSLRSIVNTALGFSCIALGVKRSAVESEGSHFHMLFKAVSEQCNKIPVPDPLPAFCYAVLHGPSDDEAEQPSVPQPTQVKVSTDIYKYRSSKKTRAFVPELPPEPQPSADYLSLDISTTSNKATCSSSVRKLSDEPLAVQDKEEVKGTQTKCKQVEFHYQPLRLKQTIPNPKKIRKKKLKKMRK
ncbi:hypothetical protein B7P43_G12267 [Cryptotermes secundus]|uniref:Ribosomal protein eL8/eL30/eS12/Gadd45 domain-containing protein n=2 Tax=Cryptotermes secundus TaxID=105785 RepID=A0A2J7QHP5_9NEOP|nr:uncharacterized protein LOC111867475 isoform X2 [Cryptotermes secundus]XP_023713150.1 uncharacterized protein LOC111867475 isoform X2 [Cryptotermes secundus]XP_023713151.1 uncharacterized protein LOC111867475 isoform X2 [Cryptotermes secundus]XP_023713152.1 uncharacterized protein LOC111867475 isoform X2 [Cryptotermes secundus]XP_023713153.1 uncharacterized protein LOC111867475 isoform X2 [Cryptotermes secundus]XP_023713154.1 uncharacterized protein LOC111867475 isoform X2 [Cryptotermes sec